MVFLSKEEYLKLIEAAQIENETEDDYYPDFPDSSWIPAKSLAKEKMEKYIAINGKTLNIFKFRKEQIRDALFDYTTLMIGEFMIHIEEYHGFPTTKNMPSYGELTLDISVWEHKTKTPSGFPCNMNFNKDFFQDNRFTNRPWLAYFNASGFAYNVPLDTVAEIAKFLSAVQRLSSFM